MTDGLVSAVHAPAPAAPPDGVRRRSRPRVAHVVPAPFGEHGVLGGAERYAHELARHMAHVVPTTLITFGDGPRRSRVESLSVRVLGPAWHVRGQPGNPLARGLARAVLDFDVVHFHQQHVLASTLGALVGRLARRRVFVSDLGGGGWDLSSYVSTDRLYHGHLHISAYSRRLAGHDGLGTARVILGGVDIERFSPDATAPRTGRALYVGRLQPHKGIDYLIEALPDGMGLDIVGREADPAYARRLAELARGRDVRFLGGIDDAALVRAYRGAACVVLPSVYRTHAGAETRSPELLGQTLLEGMACGLPAICTDVASLPEVVRDGETGFVVPPNDVAALRGALATLRDDARRAELMGRRARADVIAGFRWERVVARCLEAYDGRPW